MSDRKNDLSFQIEELKRIRASIGMNRTKFSEYIGIPRRTLEDWESGRRQMPDYVLRLITYYVAMENMNKQKGEAR